MNKFNIYPITSSDRTAIVDILRGWALIGVVLVNYFLFFYLAKDADIPKTDYVSHISRLITDIIFTNKSRILLNILFGFGFATLIANQQKIDINPVPFFIKRMIWLFIIGLINSCFYYGDFLKDYAVYGLLLLLFYKANAKTSLYIAIGLFLVYPFTGDYLGRHFPAPSIANDISQFTSRNLFNVLSYGFKESSKEIYDVGRLFGGNLFVLACFLFGQFLQKIDFFQRIVIGEISAKKIFWTSLLSTILIFIIYNVLRRILEIEFLKHYDIMLWLEFGITFVLVSAFSWLYKKDKLKIFFKGLEVVGKMTLTNYVIQNIIGIILFSGLGFGLLYNLPFYGYILIAITVFVAQVFFCKWWLSKYNYGPIEWIWRELTYMKRLPIKK